MVIGLVAVPEALDRPYPVLSIAIAVGLAPALMWRRSAPLAVVALTFGGSLLVSLIMGRDFPDLHVMVYVLLLPYALFRWGSGREAVVGAVIMVGKVGVEAALGYQTPPNAIAGVGVLCAAMALGAAVRYLSRARARELDQVKLLERERLARDLHDTVAHHVSAMAIRAQAGIAVAATDPAAAVDALRVIDAEAARALDEMRGMVRVLRTGHAELSPGPRLADLEELASDGDPAVEVELVGDDTGLPAPVAAAAYRLVQEAVTNARRHARNVTRVRVRVVVGRVTLRLRVSDDGEPVEPRPPGFGLTGMIERAALLGGTCAAGPDPDRGWTVTAVLPGTGR